MRTIFIKLDALGGTSTSKLFSASNSLSAYPNPSTEFISVKLNESDRRYVVCNVNGEIHMESEVSSDTGILRLSTVSLPAGNYYMIIYSDNDLRSSEFTVIK